MHLKNFSRTSIIIMLSFIIIGIIIGTAVYPSFPEFADGIRGFIKTAEKRTIITVFKDAFMNTFIILLVLMFSGFSAVSQPLELSVLIYRGFVLGISFSYTYALYALKGFFICILMILPHALVTSVILVLAVRESIRMSTAVAVSSFKGDADLIECPSVKMYFVKFIVLLIFLVLSSAIDCIITYLLTGMLIIK